MSLLQNAQQAYANPQAPLRTPRSLEYDLLARRTQALVTTWAQKDENFAAFLMALNDNLQLWQVFAIDVASPENLLPPDLRARLFYLYEYTYDVTLKLRRGDGGPSSLIDINRAVMRGLRGAVGEGK